MYAETSRKIITDIAIWAHAAGGSQGRVGVSPAAQCQPWSFEGWGGDWIIHITLQLYQILLTCPGWSHIKFGWKWNWPTSIHKFGSLGCWLVEAIQRCISLEHGQLAKLTWDSIYLLADRVTSIGILLATFHIICHSHDLNRFSAAHVSAQPVTVVLSLLPSHDADTTHPL